MLSKIERIDNSEVHFMYDVENMTQQEIADYYEVCQESIVLQGGEYVREEMLDKLIAGDI